MRCVKCDHCGKVVLNPLEAFAVVYEEPVAVSKDTTLLIDGEPAVRRDVCGECWQMLKDFLKGEVTEDDHRGSPEDGGGDT